ncbi:MAG: DinB family protein [Dehalococcoidales bacterium]
MEIHEILSGGYASILRVLEFTLEGLSVNDLNWQPKPDCNSIGWLVWHLTRWQDVQISAFMKEDQLWIKEGWHKKFNRPTDPKDTGGRMKPEDLPTFKSPDVNTLLGYHKAVLARSQKFFPTLSKLDLDKTVEGTPFKPPPKMGMMLIMVMSDGLQHAGQASYVRGILQGFGWH